MHAQVLCTTSTLAQGVNLPAHLVVLKGTRRWAREGGEPPGYKEYDRTTVLQMIGRAGRPQFDTEGVAVIMTQRQVRLPQASVAWKNVACSLVWA
jgi:ATP-dependent DNA helicase HFM1/MER3